MSEQLSPDLVVNQILHARERDQFVALCVASSAADLEALVPGIDAYVVRVEKAAGESSVTDVETARKLAHALQQLIAGAEGYSDDQRALVRGASEYFMLTGDDQDDLEDILGFDDDVRVLNVVAELLGRSDLVVTFD
jgi:hypothetical protein